MLSSRCHMLTSQRQRRFGWRTTAGLSRMRLRSALLGFSVFRLTQATQSFRCVVPYSCARLLASTVRMRLLTLFKPVRVPIHSVVVVPFFRYSSLPYPSLTPLSSLSRPLPTLYSPRTRPLLIPYSSLTRPLPVPHLPFALPLLAPYLPLARPFRTPHSPLTNLFLVHHLSHTHFLLVHLPPPLLVPHLRFILALLAPYLPRTYPLLVPYLPHCDPLLASLRIPCFFQSYPMPSPYPALFHPLLIPYPPLTHPLLIPYPPLAHPPPALYSPSNGRSSRTVTSPLPTSYSSTTYAFLTPCSPLACPLLVYYLSFTLACGGSTPRQVLMSTKDEMYKSWKRFSDFKLLAEYAKISDLRDTVTVWREIQQVRRISHFKNHPTLIPSASSPKREWSFK